MRGRVTAAVVLCAAALLAGGWFYSRQSGGGPADLTSEVQVAEDTGAGQTETADSVTESLQTNAEETTASATTAADADADDSSWSLILVNSDNPIPDDYTIPELTQLRNDNSVDSRIYPSLQQMFDDMRAEGLDPYITSSYRTHEYQQKLMDDKIASFVEQGMTEEEAEAEAEKWVAVPGTSEHEIGLAVDISVEPGDDDEQTAEAKQAVWDWLDANCWKYGFIRRYPEEKSSITGISNEQWHFRYVGDEAAKVMYDEDLCLEEYLEKYGS